MTVYRARAIPPLQCLYPGAVAAMMAGHERTRKRQVVNCVAYSSAGERHDIAIQDISETLAAESRAPLAGLQMGLFN